MDKNPASTKVNIGWIGTGVMGLPMAGHLMAAGHALRVHNRTRAKAQPLLDAGAEWADSPADAAAGVDVVFSMVGFPADVERVHLGGNGTLSARPLPGVIVDMTTTAPELSKRIARAAKERGVGAVDAPVSGGDIGARNATLSIMIGGEAADVDLIRPLLEKLGKNIIHHGPPGAGQHAKMVNQILIATNMIGVCEGLLYARRAGLDPLKVIESVGSGAAGSWSINNLGPRMANRNFEPGFYVEHFIKDLDIALTEAQRMGLELPGLALARRLYENVRELGYARKGTQALLLALEAMNHRSE
jgi:3-hydroxyisobutyrate dehydrogenase